MNKKQSYLITLSNPLGLLKLSKGDVISEKNFNNLIQLSKKIANTYANSINWYGDNLNIEFVIIKKIRNSSTCKDDHWLNENKQEYKYFFKTRPNDLAFKDRCKTILNQQKNKKFPILIFTQNSQNNWQYDGNFSIGKINDKSAILIANDIDKSKDAKEVNQDVKMSNNVVLGKTSELFLLKKGSMVNKRNLFELIQFSKVNKSKFWEGISNKIGNTPQQGINWIGEYPNIKGVIIKTLPGSYEEDSLNDFNEAAFNYSFKANKGVVNLQEKANLVLTNQIKSGYPILLFTTTSKQDPNWKFKGEYEVKKIHKKHVELSLLNNGASIKPKTASIVEESIALYKKPTNRKSTKSNLVAPPDLKKIFTDQFALEKSFKYGEGNPFHIELLNNDFYVFLKNISPAYYPKSPDIARIQLAKSTHFNNILLSRFPFIILGYNDEFETFTSWDPEKTKKRLNTKSNVSLFTRNSFQIKASVFTTHTISNGDKVIVFPKKLLPSFFMKLDDLYKSKETKPKNNGQSTIIFERDKISSISDPKILKNIKNLLLSGRLLEAVNICAENYQDDYPMMEINDWFNLVEKYR